MNNKFSILKKSSTILLATVLVVGFIGISSPSSIFAQYYDDDYEKSYEKYMKNDDSRPIIKNIKCNNIIKNTPDNNNIDTINALDLPNENSQSGQDRMNADQKGNFQVVCQSNNNVNNVNINPTFTTNNNLNIERNNAINQSIDQSNEACTNAIAVDSAQSETAGDNSTQNQDFNFSANQTNNCTVTQSNDGSQNATIEDNSNTTGVITSSSSIATNAEQPQAQTHVKLLQDGNGVEINKQGNEPIDIREIQSSQNNNGIEISQQGNLPVGVAQQLEDSFTQDSFIMSQDIGDSPDLTAMEKVTKLKTQWLSQLP